MIACLHLSEAFLFKVVICRKNVSCHLCISVDQQYMLAAYRTQIVCSFIIIIIHIIQFSITIVPLHHYAYSLLIVFREQISKKIYIYTIIQFDNNFLEKRSRHRTFCFKIFIHNVRIHLKDIYYISIGDTDAYQW